VYAQSAMKSFPRMLRQRLNHLLVCSGCDKIISPYAQHTVAVHVKNVKIFSLVELTRKFVRRMLIVHKKPFPRILSVHSTFESCTPNPLSPQKGSMVNLSEALYATSSMDLRSRYIQKFARVPLHLNYKLLEPDHRSPLITFLSCVGANLVRQFPLLNA
jgi:hypothetical protein